MIDLNGIAHVQLSVRDLARSREFYFRLLHQILGMSIQYDNEHTFYCIGGRTGIALTPVTEAHKDTLFDQRRVGLHHICFRLRSREDVDLLHDQLIEMNAKIVHEPEMGSWAPEYYSILFEDPDGIRLEANFVPGSGNLDRIVDGPLKPPYPD